MKFRPLHDRVVIKRIEAEQKTSGGIIIPERQAHPYRRQGRRPGAVRQVVGHRSQARWRRVHDHEGKRSDGGAGGIWRFEKGRLILQLRNVTEPSGLASQKQPSCRATKQRNQTFRSTTWLPRK